MKVVGDVQMNGAERIQKVTCTYLDNWFCLTNVPGNSMEKLKPLQQILPG